MEKKGERGEERPSTRVNREDAEGVVEVATCNDGTTVTGHHKVVRGKAN